VIRRLLDAGDEVKAFDLGINDARHRLVARDRPLGFTRVVGDVADDATVTPAMVGADRVIHLAAAAAMIDRARRTNRCRLMYHGSSWKHLFSKRSLDKSVAHGRPVL